jgi:hypothetical protein
VKNDKVKAGLISAVAKHANVPNEVADTATNFLLNHIGSILANGYAVRLLGLGVLYGYHDNDKLAMALVPMLPASLRGKRYSKDQLVKDLTGVLRRALTDTPYYNTEIGKLAERIYISFGRQFKYVMRYYGPLPLGDFGYLRIYNGAKSVDFVPSNHFNAAFIVRGN